MEGKMGEPSNMQLIIVTSYSCLFSMFRAKYCSNNPTEVAQVNVCCIATGMSCNNFGDLENV